MRSAFTLIELLIIIAILGLLAAAVLVAINPGKRLAQARDSQRKQDINVIATALISYYAQFVEYPQERTCDTSRGGLAGAGSVDCSTATGADWGTAFQDKIYPKLVTEQQLLKKLPTDPVNNQEFYYRYEPATDTGGACTQGTV